MRIPAAARPHAPAPLAVLGGATALILAVLTARHPPQLARVAGGPNGMAARPKRPAPSGPARAGARPARTSPGGTDRQTATPVSGATVSSLCPAGDVAHARSAGRARRAPARRCGSALPVYLTDIPAHRVAWASPRSTRPRQHLHLWRQRDCAASAGRQALFERSLVEESARHDARRSRDARSSTRQRHGQHADLGWGSLPAAATATSPSTRRPGRRSGSARRRRGTGTPTTRRRSSPPSAASA